jgi:hypothetical protein
MTMAKQTTSETFRAYIIFADSQPEQSWHGLTYGKARWRYFWIQRQFFAGIFRNVKAYGYEREGKA